MASYAIITGMHIQYVAHNTVKTVPTEIQSLKSAEIKGVYVAFCIHVQLQRPMLTETCGPVQSFSNGTCDFSWGPLNLSY